MHYIELFYILTLLSYNCAMGFLYRNQNYKELTDEQMITDVLITHNKITADIRNILWETGVIDFHNSTHLSVFELSNIFSTACCHQFINRDRSLINLDDDYSLACMTYENFIIPCLSNQLFEGDEYGHRRTIDKYIQYSKAIDKWYDFFMMPREKQLELLNFNKKK